MISLSGNPSWVMWGNCSCQPVCPGGVGPFQCDWAAVRNGSAGADPCCTGKLVVMDSGPFAALTAAHFVAHLPESQGGGMPFFLRHADAIEASMDAGVPLSPSGLPAADPSYTPARVGYGFADALGKSGEDLYMSVLFFDGCTSLAALHTRAAAGGANRTRHLTAAAHFRARAAAITANISALWNPSAGAFRAASVKRRDSIDVWGSAYAGLIGLATPQQQRAIVGYLLRHAEQIFFQGQAVELFPSGGASYQDGGHWATPLDKILPFIARFNSSFACGLLAQTVESFRTNGEHDHLQTSARSGMRRSRRWRFVAGVWEWVAPQAGGGGRLGSGQGAAGYIASIANTLAGAEAINDKCLSLKTDDAAESGAPTCGCVPASLCRPLDPQPAPRTERLLFTSRHLNESANTDGRLWDFLPWVSAAAPFASSFEEAKESGCTGLRKDHHRRQFRRRGLQQAGV